MTNQQILEKAIQKAKAGGFDMYDKRRTGYPQGLAGDFNFLLTYSIIFNHDFAKALWGEGKYKELSRGVLEAVGTENFGWEHHLKQLVVADDPIKYLGEHL